MSEKRFQEIERQAHLSEARKEFRRRVEYVLENMVSDGMKAADEGNAPLAAGNFFAIRSVLEKALEEEAAAYEKYGKKR